MSPGPRSAHGPPSRAAGRPGLRHGVRRCGRFPLLDVEEALVDELVDAEGAELAAEAGALGAAEGQVGALPGRGVDVGHADLKLLGDPAGALLVGGPDGAAEAEVDHVGEADRLVVAGDLV